MPKDLPTEHEVLSSSTVYEGMIWNIQSETFEFDSQILTREFVDHPGAVAVLLLNEKQELLMIRQYRHPVRAYLWEIPAGLTDVPGESRLETAKRELREETGYEASDWEHLIDFYTTPGGNNEMISIFLAGSPRFATEEYVQEGEEVSLLVEWVPIREALNSVLKSEVKSPSAAVGILALAQRLGILAN